MGETGTSRRSERRLVTCLFADVTGSTHLAETMDPEDWTDLMNRGFTAMIDPIQDYGGHVARLMGDGLLALFGAPTAHEDDPERAVMAGLGIIRSIAPLREELDAEGLVFDVRVGINTGLTVVGFVGPEGAAEYTAMGDAVNVAARMEQTATPGTVQISQGTHRFVQHSIEADAIGPVTVKGKSEPVNSYRVRRRRTRAEQEERSAPLVGRTSELDVLRQALRDLKAGIGRVVAVTGPPGAGKTRLAQALRSENDASEDPVLWWEAGGMSYDHTRPLSAVVNRTQQLYGIEPGDSRAKIRAAIEARHPDFSEDLRTSVIDAIHAGYSARDERRDVDLEGGDLHRQIANAFVTGIRTSAAAGPSIVVFDDLQWVDEASAALVSEAWRLAAEFAILFIPMMRPDEHSPGWPLLVEAEIAMPDHFTRIDLTALDTEATTELALSELDLDWIPKEIENELHAVSAGNPLFIEELTRSFVRNGAIVESNGRRTWNRAFRFAEDGASPTLRSLLTTRVDRLDPDAQALLQTVSVLGHEFSYELLATVVDHRVRDLDVMVKTLIEAGMLVETSLVPERMLAFRNEILRQVTYGRILKKDRRALHTKVAQVLEQRDTPDPYELARHYRNAGNVARAYQFSVTAGEEAMRLSSYAEAAESLHNARNLLPDPPPDGEELLRISTLLGRAHELSGKHSVALEEYERLEAAGVALGWRHVELAALIHQAVVKATFNDQFDPVSGRTVAQRAAALAKDLGDNVTLARVEWVFMLLSIFGDRDYDAAIGHGHRGVELARTHGTERNLAFLVHDLARAHVLSGRLEQGHALIQEARRRWNDLGELAMAADACAMESDYHIAVGELDGARSAAEEMVAIADKLDSDWLLAIAEGTLVTIDIERGRYERALQRFQRATALARQAGMSELLIQYSSYAAYLEGLVGDPAAGLERLDTWEGPPLIAAAEARAALHMLQGDAEAGLDELGTGQLDASAPAPMGLTEFFEVLRAEVVARAGDYRTALGEAERLEARLGGIGRRLVRIDALYVIGIARLALGDVDGALQVLEEATTEADAVGSRRNGWRVAVALAEALDTAGRRAEAARERRHARRILAEMAGAIEADDVRDRFLRLPLVAEAMGR